MSRLRRALATLLLWSAGLLPADRRVWAQALRAEADGVPAGWGRLAWLAGGVRLTAREAMLSRRFAYSMAFAAAVVGVAWCAWSGPAGDSAIVVNRVDVITMAVILAGLPWAIRRARGPVAGGGLARLVRTGGYAAVLALVLVKAAVERVADAPPNNAHGPAPAWVGEVVFLAVMAGYAAVILTFTAWGSPAARVTVAIGTAADAVLGVLLFVLGPLGFPLRFTGPWPALLPYVSGLEHWAAGHIGHWTEAASHGQSYYGYSQDARIGYVAGNSAFAAGYLIVLLLGPLLGCAFGAWAGRAGARGPCRPDGGPPAPGPAPAPAARSSSAS
jgi:hypothetical protein